MRIGCIGFGNMAQAIVQGLIKQGKIDPSMISVCAAHYDRCQQNAKKYGDAVFIEEKDVENSKKILEKGVEINIQQLPTHPMVYLKNLL